MSTLRVNAIVDSAGANTATINGVQPTNPVRAWVNFNGTGTVAIRASYNVTSITDNNTGQYTVNFTNAMPDANYSTVTGTGVFYNGFNSGNQGRHALIASQSTTNVRIEVIITTLTSYQDLPYIGVSVFR